MNFSRVSSPGTASAMEAKSFPAIYPSKLSFLQNDQLERQRQTKVLALADRIGRVTYT